MCWRLFERHLSGSAARIITCLGALKFWCLCLIFTSGLLSPLQADEKKPNILIVVLDDFGTGHFAPIAKQLELAEVDPDFLVYSEQFDNAYAPQVALEASRRAMPFMETLVEQGALFSRAFNASSLCAPSRQGILTETSPTRWAVGPLGRWDVGSLGRWAELVPNPQKHVPREAVAIPDEG